MRLIVPRRRPVFTAGSARGALAGELPMVTPQTLAILTHVYPGEPERARWCSDRSSAASLRRIPRRWN
jgi:hypothetical protein